MNEEASARIAAGQKKKKEKKPLNQSRTHFFRF